MEISVLKELLKTMVSIPSFSREESAVADYLQNFLSEAGFDVQRKGHNIWIEQEGRGDGRPVILLNAHIDTVRPASAYTRNPFEATEEDGKIFGLGTNDDGASLVALLAAYVILSSKAQPYRLIWSATAEEEISGQGGLEMILPELGHIDLGIIGEPTGMQMAVAERGLLVLDCTASGVSGHAARNEGENALYKAIKDIEWFREYHFPAVSDYLGDVKMTVTMINCGTQHNVVPDKCDFVVDVRPNGMYTNSEILDTIHANVSSSVRPRSLRHNSSHIDVAHPVVQRGFSLGLEAFGSPTTSNQTVSNFTTLKIGPGQSSRSHSADEYICIDEIAEGVEIYVKLLDSLVL